MNNIICTLGIGSGASSELVNNIAKVGNGISDMIENESVLSSTVIKQLKYSKSKVIDQLYLEFNNQYAKFNIELISKNKIYDNTLVTLYGIYDEDISYIIEDSIITLKSKCNTINEIMSKESIIELKSNIDHKLF